MPYSLEFQLENKPAARMTPVDVVGELASDRLLLAYANASLSDIFYTNEMKMLPEQLILHELLNFVFAASVFFHALTHCGLHLFFGFCIFGFLFETIGILTGSHCHPQYLIQVTYYAPLKEVLWYSLTLWPSYYLATSLKLDMIAEACLVGLLQMGVNIPYETAAPREGLQLIFSNEDFLYANLMNKWFDGTCMNILANLILPIFVTIIIRLCKEADCSRFSTLLAVALSPGLCGVIGFTPVNVMKFWGCYKILLDIDISNIGFLYIHNQYSYCMRNSEVEESSILGTLITLCIVIVVSDLAGKDQFLSFKVRKPSSYYPFFFTILGQNLEYMYLVCFYDKSGKPVLGTLILYLNILLLNIWFLCFIVKQSMKLTKDKLV